MNPIIFPYRSDKITRLPLFARPVTATAPIDESAHVLNDFLQAGFREVEWRYGFESWQNQKLWRQMGSVCPVCFALDGQRFKIEWLLQSMTHNAPKYTMAHVGCQCQLFRISRTEELLDYSEQVSVEPKDISEELTRGPIDLEQVPQDQRSPLGLPEEQNGWTDIRWIWDAQRNEYVPLKTLLEEGADVHPFIWDKNEGAYLPHEDWVRRYGLQ